MRRALTYGLTRRNMAHTYRAFISYSHADKKWADWLHRTLESYAVPKRLVGEPSPLGPRPARLKPVFRDREELASASDLGEKITRALEDSAFLIVICSPRAAKSKWVNEEILAFRKLGRADRILALIVEGEPAESFPPALREAEPIAADARPTGDGKRNAFLKIAAGLLGVGFDALKQRDAVRRRRRFVTLSVVASAAMVVAGVLIHRAERASKALRENAPELHALAMKLAMEGKLDDALKKIEDAIELDRGNASFHVMRGNQLQALLRLRDAEKAYEHALKLDPGLDGIRANIDLCRRLAAKQQGGQDLSDEDILALQFAMYEQDRLGEALGMLLASGRTPNGVAFLWRDVLAKRGVALSIQWVQPDEFGFPRISIGNYMSNDAPDLKGIPVTQLSIRGKILSNLESLKGLKLRRLTLTKSSVQDLRPLADMPLENLSLNGTKVMDLAPLAGMSLRLLNISQTPIRDISPLATLSIPTLDLTGCLLLQDVSPLREMRNLQYLVLPPNATNVQTLRDHPMLERISFLKSTKAGTLTPSESTEEFWAKFDAGTLVRMGVGAAVQYELVLRSNTVAELRELDTELASLDMSGLDVSDISALTNVSLVVLNLQDNPVSNISALAGMPLQDLNLRGTAVEDLHALSGAPLRVLNLADTKVSDLSPLRGQPLEELELSRPTISDLTPIAGMPISRIRLTLCKQITDLGPLLACTNLTDAIVPEGSDVAVLRNHPSLQRLSFKSTLGRAWSASQTVGEFWATFDEATNLVKIKDIATNIAATAKREPVEPAYEVTFAGRTNIDLTSLAGQKITGLNLNDTKVEDLSPLRGLPLVMLGLNDTRVVDLSPLTGMPLERLNLGLSSVRDLRPLIGAPMQFLSIAETRVSDLSPLRGMPLEELLMTRSPVATLEPLRGSSIRRLGMRSCKLIQDLSPLLSCTNLEEVVLPDQGNVEILRGHPSLKRLSFAVAGGGMWWYPKDTVAEFWAEYDRTAPERAATAANKAAVPTTVLKEPDVEIKLSALNKTALLAAKEKTVFVEGTVLKVYVSSRSGTTFLTFGRSGIHTLTVFVTPAERTFVSSAFKGGLASLSGRVVRIHGELGEYEGVPDMKVSDPAQIQLLETPKAETQRAAAGAGRESQSGSALEASNSFEISSRVDQDVVVRGLVSIVIMNKNSKGARIVFKNVPRSGFYAILFEESYDVVARAFGGDLATALQGRVIEVNGRIGLYKGIPQIVVRTPSQIRIVEE